MTSKRPGRASGKPGVDRPAPTAQLKIGDERRGFELSIDKASRMLRVRLWGLWHVATAALFREGIIKLANEVKRDAKGAPWGILVDSRMFVAQSPEVTEVRKRAMVQVGTLGCAKIAAVVDAAVYSIQFKRIASESNIASSVFKDEASALEWLLGSSKHANEASADSPRVARRRSGRPDTLPKNPRG